MKAIILCGGQGSRLREHTEFVPKGLVEIGGRPIMWHIMKLYAHHGITDFVLCLGYKGEVIKDYFLNYHAMQNDFTVNLGSLDDIRYHGRHREEAWNVTLVDTGPDTLTAERILRVREHIEDDTFLVTYCDGVSDVNMSDLIRFHREQGRLATFTGVRDVSRFGVVQEENGKVLGFKEKPQLEDRINAGFFVFDPGSLGYFEGQKGMLEDVVLPSLASDGELSMHKHEGFLHCMDTYRDMLKLEGLWRDCAPWKVWE